MTALAAAAATDLKDTDYAKQLYRQAAEKMEKADDLMALAKSLVESLADKALALDVYQNAESKCTTFEQLTKLAKAILADTGDTGAAGEVYKKTAVTNPNAKQLVEVAEAMATDIQDKPATMEFLKQAELAVKSNDEFKKTADAILKLADDPQWIEAIKDQQTKREAHKALYDDFINREGECQTAGALIKLAHDVVNQTGDKHYARKLYGKAQALSNYFPEFLSVADAVSADLQDSEWIREIYTAQLEKCVEEIDYHRVVDGILANLNDSDWVKEIYSGLEERAGSADDYVRLARTVLDKLGDDQWSGKLFDQAKEASDSTASCAAVAIALQDSLGDTERVGAVFAKAQSLSTSVNDYDALFRAATRRSEFSSVVRAVIEAAEQNLSGAMDLKHLAECVLNYMDDPDRARRIYQKALEAPNASRRHADIIVSIKNSLGDEAWALKLARQP